MHRKEERGIKKSLENGWKITQYSTVQRGGGQLDRDRRLIIIETDAGETESGKVGNRETEVKKERDLESVPGWLGSGED
jgi:hypothetical protein